MKIVHMKKRCKKDMVPLLKYAVSVVLSLACLIPSSAVAGSRTRNLSYLEDFAKIYGVARWFMPADEAADVDWNALALYGAHEIPECASDEEFYRVAESVFSGFVPMFEISGHRRSARLDKYYAERHDGMKPVYWQHKGADLSIFSNKYSGKRVSRDAESFSLNRLAVFGYLPVKPGNDTLTVVFRVKAAPSDESAHPYFGIVLDTYDYSDPVDYMTQLAQDEKKAFRADPEWKEISYSAVTGENSHENLFWALYIVGKGDFVVDNMRICDSRGNSLASVNFRDLASPENSFHILNGITHEYAEALDGLHVSLKNRLFEEDRTGTYCSIPISGGRYAHVPMLLWSDDNHTCPACGYKDTVLYDEEDVDAWMQDAAVAEMADIMTAWNVIRYFSPYLHEQGMDWDRELRLALRRASESRSGRYEVLRRMMAKINDAHVTYMNFPDNFRYFFPARMKLSGRKAVVAESYDPALKKGDRLLSLDGKRISGIIEDFASLESGSWQSKIRKIEAFAFHSEDSIAGCRVRRSGRSLEMQIRMMEAGDSYGKYYSSYQELLNANRSRYLNDGILYLNPGQSTLEEIKGMLDEHTAGAPVIVDLRFSSTFLIRYIMPLLWEDLEYYDTQPDTCIPEVSFLNTDCRGRRKMPEYRKIRKSRENNIVFLINSSCMSNQEEFLDYVKHKGLACLIGENTAGICGNINVIPLPSGRMAVFTGERCYSIAGRKGDYFIRGVKPDIRVSGTVADALNGNDPVLDRAVEYLCR